MKRICSIVFTVLLTLQAMAQTKTVSGTVKDGNGEPLIGVGVIEMGTTNGTATDLDGAYQINVKENAILTFSCIGFTDQEISVSGKSVIDVVMDDDAQLLNDVVVVGYGTQKKSSMTASVASISSKEVSKMVTSNVASALLGRTPGVEILQNGGEAGGDISIIIRGAGSFGATEPLYVIDGAISSNGINLLNPNDIASIEILKDGAAAAIYGSRAANGVVLITTKNGKAGKVSVELNGSFSYQTPTKMLDFMNADQWREYANMVCDNSPSFDRAPQNVNPTNPRMSNDWQELYYQNAPMYNIGANVSGGSENATFSASIGYTNQNGIVIQSGYEKYNARVNGMFKKGRLTVQENLAIAHSKKQIAPSNRMIEMPTIPVVDEFGRYVSTPLLDGYSTTNADITNPLAAIYARDQYVKKTEVTGSISAAIDIWNGLKFKSTFSGSLLNSNGYNHTPEYASYWEADGTPNSTFSQPYTSLDETRATNFNYTIDNLLTYKNTFGGHTIDALLGHSWMREFYRMNGINTGVTDLGAPSITTYNGAGTISSDEANAALLSFFARLNYDYDERYLFSASVRRDESSKFAKEHRVGYFPSVSAGWNIHNEPWFNVPVISKLKLRASYGELGANFIDPYSFLSLAYGPVPTIFNNKRQYGYVTRLAQYDLTWETSVSKNIALETSFFNDALSFSVEYFNKVNRDLLAPLEALPSSGQTIIVNDGDIPYYNTASVENKGLELMLGYRKQLSRDWHIDIQGNMSFLKNNVIALGEGVQPIRGSLMSSKFSDRPTITQPGLPIGTFWGYKVVGLSDSGDFLYEAADGTPKVAAEVGEADKQVIGDPTPDFTYGLNINLNYKNWDFTAFFQGTYGNDIFAAAKYQFYFNPDNNALADALNSWTPSNKNTNLPIAKTDNFNGGNSLPSSFYIEDGSYFRCKNLQIGYTFSEEQLARTGFLSGLRIFASIQNLFTITKYPLYDPEVSSNTLFDRGIDGLYQTAPMVNARAYNIGFNVTF